MPLSPAMQGTSGVGGSRKLSHRLVGLAYQFGRYGVVSAVALIADFALFLMLAHSGMKAPIAGAIGYGVGMIIHFALSSRYVFSARDVRKSGLRLFGEFAFSGIIGLVITAATIDIAVNQLHAPAVVAKILAVGISFTVVFLLRRQVVFRRRTG